MKAICRDCFWTAERRVERCGACDSRRVIVHEELDRLTIAHLDCDAFYASVEKRDRPELRDRPVIVGGGKPCMTIAGAVRSRRRPRDAR